MRRRMFAAELYLLLGFMLLSLYLTLLMYRGQYQETAVRQSRTVLTAGYAEGTVYDRQMQPLVNRSTAYYAAASPSAETVRAILPHAEEMQPILDGIRTGKPFLCRVDTPDIACDAVTVVRVPQRGQGRLHPGESQGWNPERRRRRPPSRNDRGAYRDAPPGKNHER